MKKIATYTTLDDGNRIDSASYAIYGSIDLHLFKHINFNQETRLIKITIWSVSENTAMKNSHDGGAKLVVANAERTATRSRSSATG